MWTIYLYGVFSGAVAVFTFILLFCWKPKSGRVDIPDIKKDSEGNLWVVTDERDGMTFMVRLIPDELENLKEDKNEKAVRHC